MDWFVGTAGWTVPRQHLPLFEVAADSASSEVQTRSHLERYARRLPCVEINSSFHRPHRIGTWRRWAAAVPEGFRFAVKAPKTVTHDAKLVGTGSALQDFFDQVRTLGQRLGPVLFQLPPMLEFDEGIAREFFITVRELHSGATVLEPRNAGWFSASADRLLREFEIARAAADPPKGSHLAAQPGGWPGLHYWRLHGAPRTYYSDYDSAWLQEFAVRLRSQTTRLLNTEAWVIFDNTAMGHASANAIALQQALSE